MPMHGTLVEIYTDGACRGNPGPGGWGALLKYNGREKELYGSEQETTNNRMELTAAIMALNELTRPCHIRLTTDSVYVRNGIMQWLAAWKARGWKTAARKAVKNADLWKKLDLANSRHEIEWCWVKGHSGNTGNEHADMLANRAIDELLSGSDLI